MELPIDIQELIFSHLTLIEQCFYAMSNKYLYNSWRSFLRRKTIKQTFGLKFKDNRTFYNNFFIIKLKLGNLIDHWLYDMSLTLIINLYQEYIDGPYEVRGQYNNQYTFKSVGTFIHNKLFGFRSFEVTQGKTIVFIHYNLFGIEGNRALTIYPEYILWKTISSKKKSITKYKQDLVCPTIEDDLLKLYPHLVYPSCSNAVLDFIKIVNESYEFYSLYEIWLKISSDQYYNYHSLKSPIIKNRK